MSPKTLILRKFRARWSDLQLLVLMQLAEDELAAFAEIVRKTNASETGVWNALQAIRTQDCADVFEVEGKFYYHLTDKGRRNLAGILGK